MKDKVVKWIEMAKVANASENKIYSGMAKWRQVRICRQIFQGSQGHIYTILILNLGLTYDETHPAEYN